MKRVQALIIQESPDKRVVKMTRVDGLCTGIEENVAVIEADGVEVRVPVQLVRGLDRPDILRSAVAMLNAEVIEDRACLFAAVGEVVEMAEELYFMGPMNEYVVPMETFQRRTDAYRRMKPIEDEVA